MRSAETERRNILNICGTGSGKTTLANAIGVADLVRDTLRMRPDRIVVGEMCDGAPALETPKNWNTSHPGGLSALHANSSTEALLRIGDLIAEVACRAPSRMIGRVAHIRRTPRGRCFQAVIAVNGFGGGGCLVERLA